MKYTVLAREILNGKVRKIAEFYAPSTKTAREMAMRNYYKKVTGREQMVVANESQMKEFWENQLSNIKFDPNNSATYSAPVKETVSEKMTKFILGKLDNNSEAEINRVRDNKQFFIKCYSGKPTAGDDTWFLYDGCDLVIGDVTLSNLVIVLLNEMA